MRGKLIVRIAEGLGNQLFMYANSYAISKKINYDLLIDNESAYFQNKNIRNYQLHNFKLNSNICNNIFKFNSYLKHFKRKLLIKTEKFRKNKIFLIEKRDKYKKTKFENFKLSNLASIVYVEGHFESENYFKDFKNELKYQFNLKDENNYNKNKFYDLIKSNDNIVSICVRQNRFSERILNKFDDNSKLKSDIFLKLTIDYIFRAIKLVENKINNPKFFLWSNDFTNLRNYFPSNKFTFVDINNNKPLTDFYLLLNCKNFIVGPTSFHWWPAWLNNNGKNLIIRPKNINVSNNINFWPKNWISI